jgi:signal peptidase
MFSRIRYSSFFSGLLVTFVALIWIVFLPIQFGGVTAYVVVDGNSMEPTYHKGDLVILRRESAYAVGDIIAYFNTEINKHVIHRIIAKSGDKFTLKGDNNAWMDGEQPTIDSVIGKAWIYLPGLGDWLIQIQSPLGIAALSGLILFFVIGMYAARERNYRARIKKLFSGLRPTELSVKFSEGDATMKTIGRQLEILIFAFVILISASLILAVVSFSRDENQSETVDTEYVHIGLFSYSAQFQPGVYDPGSPTTGDPIFLKTTCQVNVNYVYQLGGTALSDAKGTISLRAETNDINGWTRTFPLAAEKSFVGTSAYVQAGLNPCEILTALREAETMTLLRRESYNLVLIPEVKITANAYGQPLENTFAPRLIFYLDDYQLYVLKESPEIDPLSPFRAEKQATATHIPNMIQLPGFAISVRLARILSVMGLLMSVGLGIFVAVSVSGSMKHDPSVAISLRYGTLLVNVDQASFDLRSREIIVASIEDIVKLAERNATAIMHLHREDTDEFLVEGNSVVYRYILPHRRRS